MNSCPHRRGHGGPLSISGVSIPAVLAVAAIAGLVPIPWAKAASVVIDEDTTITAMNSLPDTGNVGVPLVVDVVGTAPDSSTVSVVSGGRIGGFVFLHDVSHLILDGGKIDALTTVSDNATLTLTGGSIAPRAAWYRVADPAGVIRVADSGTVNLMGGEFVGKLLQHDASTVNIFGHSFVVEGEIPTASSHPSGVRIQGIYPSGTPFDITIVRDINSSKVFLHAVPEPMATVSCFSIWFLYFGSRVAIRFR